MLKNKTLEKIILFDKPDTKFEVLDTIIARKPEHFCIDKDDLAVGLLHIYCGTHSVDIDQYKIYGYKMSLPREDNNSIVLYLFLNEEQHNYIQEANEEDSQDACEIS